MITNSKPERCEVCGGTPENPLVSAYSDSAANKHWHETFCCLNACRPCTAPIHLRADKHKRVAERQFQKLEDMLCQPMQNLSPEVLIALADILREEYPE